MVIPIRDCADMWSRIAAAVLDLFILTTTVFLLAFAAFDALFFRGFTVLLGLPLLVGCSVSLAYFVLFEVYQNGQTFGKILVGIKVVNMKNEPVTLTASVLRNLLRCVDFLPFLYFLGFIVIVLSEKRQRIGDRVAGTMVVRCHDSRV